MPEKGTLECETCKFNVSMDDDKVECEFLKMIGKYDPKCEKYEKRE
ncbi:MAG: hypothetical protein ACTSVI_08540 [Promethearchaeota archaeon]